MEGLEDEAAFYDAIGPDCAVSRAALRKVEAEMRRQEAFEEELRALRRELEDALFAKPVCAACEEECKM